ncbi:MAG: hypothetical protein LUG49_06055 [Oscillospiraceae bacterium]|nr:hypothetical protein [Oscillospiraceae bacterium]
MTEREIDARLKIVYSLWLDEINEVAPELLNDNKYSNPYFTCVPKGWCDSAIRILVVGEEGYGVSGHGKSDGVKTDEIQKIQELCWCSLVSNLGYELDYELYPIQSRYEKYRSKFWDRVRKLSEYGVCAWTNQDTIHLRKERRCALKPEERTRLHSTKTKLLAEEINALKPTHVVVTGWYHTSIREELPELYYALYPQNGDAWYVNSEHEIAYRKVDGIHYLFTYHPGWWKKPKGYEEEVMKVFLGTLDEKDGGGEGDTY